MKKIFLSVFVCLLFLFTITGYSQNKMPNNSIGISIPVIWNNSEATYYVLTTPNKSNSNTTNYGLNLNYSRKISNKFFLTFGLGYFKQKFNLNRPCNFYDTLTRLLYISESYEYDNLNLMFGLGYVKYLNKDFLIKSILEYHLLNSFRQKYTPTYWPTSTSYSQVNKKNFNIGNTINLCVAIEKTISPSFSLGLGTIIPIYIHWNKDEMFFKSDYFDKSQQIAKNKFSIGASISLNYRF